LTVVETPPVDYRELMKKVEHVVAAIERADDVGHTLHTVIESVVSQFRAELGIFGGRVYRRRGKRYHLEGVFGEAKQPPEDLRISAAYPPVRSALEDGVVVMTSEDPGVDRDLEDQLGTDVFAAVEVGRGDFLLAFDVAPGTAREDLHFSLSILRHAVNQKIRQERMAGIFDEARRIQLSILPRRSPEFGPFDIYGHTESMESVGGDFFDFIPITPKILGLAVADVSGHGLPAALQVRDIYVGLRMGMARDFKIIRTVERLNGIIHQSTLTSRFVSLFYGELELDGTFIYVNAGHPPPYHLKADGTAVPLEQGGAVLGPLAEATYDRGFVSLTPGDLMVLYTDGLTEARGRAESGEIEEYGVGRLLDVARRHRQESAHDIVEALRSEVRAFRLAATPQDDQTVLVIKRGTA
jgi:serine phosphatase RsbU (regulator of sigma subunit)